jgi:hypothetical protein
LVEKKSTDRENTFVSEEKMSELAPQPASAAAAHRAIGARIRLRKSTFLFDFASAIASLRRLQGSDKPGYRSR